MAKKQTTKKTNTATQTKKASTKKAETAKPKKVSQIDAAIKVLGTARKRSACAANAVRLVATQCETMRLGASRGDLARRKENHVSSPVLGAYVIICDSVRRGASQCD